MPSGGRRPTLRPLPGRILGFPALPSLPLQRDVGGVRPPHGPLPELQAAQRGSRLRQVGPRRTSVCGLLCRPSRARRCCFRCEEGYYGDPPSGQPCEPCRCPDVRGSGRFFATSCRQEGQRPGLTCACREGHRGRSPVCPRPPAGRASSGPVCSSGPSCDRCSPGYYGNLASPGASCQLCLCNNNIDPDDRNACDGVTGECLRCLHNTVGPQCHNCKPGYYGNALAQDCKGKEPNILLLMLKPRV